MTARTYPRHIDARFTSEETLALLDGFYRAKSRRDLDAVMAYISPACGVCGDATFGFQVSGREKLGESMAGLMSTLGTGFANPIRILGEIRNGDGGVVVELTDTPAPSAAEVRGVSVVDVRDGKIVRFVDYWDSSSLRPELYGQLRLPQADFPSDFGEAAGGGLAHPRAEQASRALSAALSQGDAKAAAATLAYDAILEDRALRRQIIGAFEVERYLSRLLPVTPYGLGSKIQHVVGGPRGGGFEWTAAAAFGGLPGVTALELDPEGQISRLSVVYDLRALAAEARAAIAAAESAGWWG
jgi:hypothetical protein